MDITILSASQFLAGVVDAIADFCVKYGMKLIGAILLLVVGLWIIKVLVSSIQKAKWFGKVSKDVQGFARSGIKIVLTIVLVVTVISILGVPMASIVAVIASCGVVVGLALQGSLSNLAGGLMILIFKPFHVGDYIVSGSLEGSVEEIGIFYTSVTTLDNRRVVLPNASLSNSNLVNVSHYNIRRVDIMFPVEGGADIDVVASVLNNMAKNTPKILPDREIFARFAEFGNGCAKYQVRVWCNTSDYWDVFYDLLENGKRALAENGIKVPLPQMEVHTQQK